MDMTLLIFTIERGRDCAFGENTFLSVCNDHKMVGNIILSFNHHGWFISPKGLGLIKRECVQTL